MALPQLYHHELSDFNGITPRDFQTKLLTSYLEYQSTIRKAVAIAVCGAGKTLLSGMITKNFVINNYRVVFLVDSLALPDQTLKSFQALGLNVTVFHNDYEFNPFANVIIATIQTVDSKLRKGATLTRLFGEVGLWIFDEVHKNVKTKLFDLVDTTQPQSNILGLTATPYRAKRKEYLGLWFNLVLEGPQPGDMIDQGITLQDVIYSVDLIKEEELRTDSSGEYDGDSQDDQIIKIPSLDCILDNYEQRFKQVPAAFYCATVKSALALADRARERGIPFDTQTAATPTTRGRGTKGLTRKEQFQAMLQGDLWGLATVGTMVYGFDLPIIGCVGMVRASKFDRAWWLQALGRAARPLKGESKLYPMGKHYYGVLDFGGNYSRFGSPSNFQNWDISDPSKRPSPEQFFKTCPSCGSCLSPFTRVCECGHVFGQDSVNLPKLHQEVEMNLTVMLGTRLQKIAIAARNAIRESYRNKQDPYPLLSQITNLSKFGGYDDWVKGSIFGPAPDTRFKIIYWNHLNDLGLPKVLRQDLFYKEFGHRYE